MQLLERTCGVLCELEVPGTDRTLGVNIGVAAFRGGESGGTIC
jgi:hypothetical protein